MLASRLNGRQIPWLVMALLLGELWVQQWPTLPGYGVLALLALLVVLFWRCGLALPAAGLFGILWACVYGHWRLAQILPLSLEGREVEISGYIADFPRQHDDHVGFDFIVTQAPPGIPDKIRLAWYRRESALMAGEGWRLTVRLKQPFGRFNPGGFDYEAWLFANGIGATGYVRDHPAAIPLDAGIHFWQSLAAIRQSLARRIDGLLPDSKQAGVIKALTIGSQDGISQQQWRVFRDTGVIHLVVISGSHISLVAGWIFVVMRRFWARFGSLRFAPHQVAAVTACIFGWAYALLAGFSLPTQRAALMLLVITFALLSQRNISIWQVLALALAAVLLTDPLAVLAVGFWLSFVAVALLLYIATARLGRAGFWREIWQSQWVVTLGLAPLLLLFFQRVSLISPMANWLAVPLVGLLLVPLSLLALLLSWLFTDLAAVLMQAIDWLLNGAYLGLQQMAAWPLATASLPAPGGCTLLLAIIGVLWLLAPQGLPARYLGGFLLIPLLWPPSEQPALGEMRFTLLDVGQGLASVIQTANHVLVFDTGARFSEQSDMGESVLLPYLHQQAIRRVDRLVISHGDIDHRGGANALLEQMPVGDLMSTAAEFAERTDGQWCRSGQRWRWDEVDFAMLGPGGVGLDAENDNSCVLKISAGGHGLLLTGDIEQAAEHWLLLNQADQLPSELLVAPHHGSKTSSSAEFLAQVHPKTILIPAGHLNRYGFPHSQVLARYRELAADYYVSGEAGAILVEINSDGVQLSQERQRRRRYWMNVVGDAK